MGLDQFAYKVKKAKRLNNFSCPDKIIIDRYFDYWRKFYLTKINV